MYNFFDNFLDICLSLALSAVLFSTLCFFIDFDSNDLENRVEVLEKYHENEHYCPYCNSVINNVKEI